PADVETARQAVSRAEMFQRNVSTISLLAGDKPLLHFVPVHYVPPRVDVIRAAVLVLEVVRVLPHVEAHYRGLALHQRAVLIGGRDDVELARFVLDQPRPARAEACGSGGGKFLLELIEPAEGTHNGLGDLSLGLAAL